MPVAFCALSSLRVDEHITKFYIPTVLPALLEIRLTTANTYAAANINQYRPSWEIEPNSVCGYYDNTHSGRLPTGEIYSIDWFPVLI